ncbi:MAG: hypothetical protein IPN01_32775 [Deltaproteobacteria bacterium]|nr:hypothetical protein [Deltaproteobacteria bacterium]
MERLQGLVRPPLRPQEQPTQPESLRPGALTARDRRLLLQEHRHLGPAILGLGR